MNPTRLVVLAGLVVSASTIGACSANTSDEADTSEGAQSVQQGPGGTASLPIEPWNDGRPLNKSAVLNAFKLVRDSYYVAPGAAIQRTMPAGASGQPWAAGQPLPANEPVQCLGNAPAHYSDLMMHFYCWHPAYASIPEATRGCFSVLGPSGIQGVANGTFYPMIYDFCTYQPYDYLVNPKPTFNPATIKANMALGSKGKVGALRWVSENEEDVFKYVAFTWYNPFAFDNDDQQEVLNAFYGVKLTKKDYTAADQADVAACRGTQQNQGIAPGGGRPLRSGDPGDGTHCSTAKKMTLQLAKKNAAVYDGLMKQLASGVAAVDVK